MSRSSIGPMSHCGPKPWWGIISIGLVATLARCAIDERTPAPSQPGDGGDLPLGSDCTEGSRCASTHCVNNVCCQSACDACSVCSAQGECEAAAAGSAVCLDGACQAIGGCTDGGTPPANDECDAGESCDSGAPSNVCEGVPVPAGVTPLTPMRGTFTGSMRAPATRQTLRPRLTWTASGSDCTAGAVSYQVQLDDSCTPGLLASCAFASPEVDASVSTAQFQPALDLPVSSQPPVGALYAWRVRACDAAARCSAWSDVAYLHVGRTQQDVNGDGYADVLAGLSVQDVYYGGPGFDSAADAQITVGAPGTTQARFIGDVNGDGFGDWAFLEGNFDVCGSAGLYPVITFGAANLSEPERQVFCSVAGSPSVIFGLGHVGDLNADGFDDLGFMREFTDYVFRVILGGTSIAPTAELELDVGILLEDGTTLASYPHTGAGTQQFEGGGDFDGDGFADVVIVGDGRRAGGLLRQRLLLGAATLNRSFAGTEDVEGCGNPWVSRLGDIDGDARDDWAVVCGLTTAGSRFGTIPAALGLTTSLSDGFDTTERLLVASHAVDFDGDGTLEVFITLDSDVTYIWRRGAFDPLAPTTGAQLFGGDRLTLADHNGDGRLDLLTWISGSAPYWAAGASLTVTPIQLSPFSGSTSPAAITF